MPFIEIKGLEHNTPQTILEAMEEQVETALANALGCGEDICHASLYVIHVERKPPKVFVWGTITTAFFAKCPESEEARTKTKAATQEIAQVVWDLLDGKTSVEIFPPPYMDQSLRTLIKKREA